MVSTVSSPYIYFAIPGLTLLGCTIAQGPCLACMHGRRIVRRYRKSASCVSFVWYCVSFVWYGTVLYARVFGASRRALVCGSLSSSSSRCYPWIRVRRRRRPAQWSIGSWAGGGGSNLVRYTHDRPTDCPWCKPAGKSASSTGPCFSARYHSYNYTRWSFGQW